MTYKKEFENWERMFLETHLARCGNNVAKMARELEMNRGTLRTKLKQHGLLSRESKSVVA